MRKALRVLLVVLAVPLLAYAGLALAVGRDGVWAALFGPGERGAVEFRGLAPPDRPNRHLVCPRDLCARPDAESPVLPVPAEAQRAAWDRLLQRHGARILSEADGQIEVEMRTPWLRFPDLVSIRVLPLGADRSTVAVYSRSLYGHSDLGVNAGRVRDWLEELRAGS